MLLAKYERGEARPAICISQPAGLRHTQNIIFSKKNSQHFLFSIRASSISELYDGAETW